MPIFRDAVADMGVVSTKPRPAFWHLPLRRTLHIMRPENEGEEDILYLLLTTPIEADNTTVNPLIWFYAYCSDLKITPETAARMFTIYYRDQELACFPVHRFIYHERLNTDRIYLYIIELAPMLSDFFLGVKLYDEFFALKKFPLDDSLLILRPSNLINPCEDVLYWIFEFHRLPQILNLRGKKWLLGTFSRHFSDLITLEECKTERITPLVFRYRVEEQSNFVKIDTPKGKGLPRLFALYARFEHWQKKVTGTPLFENNLYSEPCKEVIKIMYENRPTRGRHVCYDPLYYHALGIAARRGVSLAIFKIDEFVAFYREQEKKDFDIVKPYDHLLYFQFLEALSDVFNPNAVEASVIRLLVEQRKLIADKPVQKIVI